MFEYQIICDIGGGKFRPVSETKKQAFLITMIVKWNVYESPSKIRITYVFYGVINVKVASETCYDIG